MLHLAAHAWQCGEAIAADQALPVYVRDQVALTTVERLALKAKTP
jgi:tRNA threonylcarbamoyladenosine biosynthesis protein TsaB